VYLLVELDTIFVQLIPVKHVHLHAQHARLLQLVKAVVLVTFFKEILARVPAMLDFILQAISANHVFHHVLHVKQLVQIV